MDKLCARRFLALVLLALSGWSCTPTVPRDALELRQESLALRQLQTRRFDSGDEKKLLSASAAVLQDLGFNLDESETALGVVVGSKQRDATNAGQIAGAIVLALLTGANTPTDRDQRIRASIVSRPVDANNTAVRVTFQRTVWNTQNQISLIESIEEAKIYQEFFDKLSKAVFLEAHNL